MVFVCHLVTAVMFYRAILMAVTSVPMGYRVMAMVSWKERN